MVIWYKKLAPNPTNKKVDNPANKNKEESEKRSLSMFKFLKTRVIIVIKTGIYETKSGTSPAPNIKNVELKIDFGP